MGGIGVIRSVPRLRFRKRLGNDLEVVFINDIADLYFPDHRNEKTVGLEEALQPCILVMHSVALSRNHAIPFVLRR